MAQKTETILTAESSESPLRSVVGATIVVVLINILTRVLTVVTQATIASRFGTSIQSDAFIATERLPEIFIEIVAIGLSMVFIPAFTEIQVLNKEKANRFANSFFIFIAIISVVLAITTALLAPVIVSILAPGFGRREAGIAIPLVRIMSLSILFLGLDGGIRGLLQAHKRFGLSESARILYNGAFLFAALFFTRQFGVIALAWGIVAGSALQLILQLVGALRTGELEFKFEFYWSEIRETVYKIFPFIIGVINFNIITFIDQMVASSLDAGKITALIFATRLIYLPVGIFAIPLRTTLYPDISKYSAEKKFTELGDTVLSGLRLLMFLIVPTSIGIILLRFPLIRILFERGAFDAVATRLTSDALLAFAIGVPAIAMIFVLNNVFLAIGKIRWLVIFSVIAWILNWTLSKTLSVFWGHVGISIATSIVTILLALAMILTLSYLYLPSLSVNRIARSTFWISLNALIMGVAVFATGYFLRPMLDLRSPMHLLIQIGAMSAVGALTYGIMGVVTRMEEVSQLRKMINI